jgi:hypothetical protein
VKASGCRVLAGATTWILLLGAGAARGGSDEAAIRSELARVYERPEFRQDGDLLTQLFRWLAKIFDRLGTLHGDSPVLFWVVLVSCLVLLALLLGHVTWTVVRAVFPGRRPGVDSLAEERRRLSASFQAEADASAAAGQFTEAVRLLFLCLVYAFDEAGRVPFRPALTNREYLHFFDDRPHVAGNLRVFVDLLDANWYGQRTTRGDEYDSCRSLFDSVRSES